MESTDPAYWKEVRASVEYANAHGVEIGGYNLIAASLTGKGFDTIDPATGTPSGSTCFASGWNRELLEQFLRFIKATGLSMVELDGSYAGTPCGSKDHDHYNVRRHLFPSRSCRYKRVGKKLANLVYAYSSAHNSDDVMITIYVGRRQRPETV